MGKMTKYLRQLSEVQIPVLNNNGEPVLDDYGQPKFSSPVRVKCRKETYNARSSTGYGQFVDYKTTYYFDESVEITSGATVDGHEVQNIEEYVDGIGTLIGYRVDV